MTYVNFYLDAVEKTMRALYAETFVERLAGAETADEEIGYLAQQRFNEMQIGAQIEMLRLINEGRDAAFIGKTVGAFVGNIMLNTLAASKQPDVCIRSMDQVIQNSMAVLTGDANSSVSISHCKIVGTKGGRA